MTDTKATLAGALLEFQRDPPHIAKDATNPHFKSKYPSLDGIMDVVRPALTKVGLVLTQHPTYSLFSATSEPQPALRTRLTHAESGEFFEDTMLLLAGKLDPQGQGSAITYARRYSVLSLLGLVGDEDDDGNAASRRNEGGLGDADVPKTWAKVKEGVTKLGPEGAWENFEAFIRAASYHQFGEIDSQKLTPDQRKVMLQKTAGAYVWMVEHDDTPLGGSFNPSHMRAGWAAVLDGAVLESPEIVEPTPISSIPFGDDANADSA